MLSDLLGTCVTTANSPSYRVVSFSAIAQILSFQAMAITYVGSMYMQRVFDLVGV